MFGEGRLGDGKHLGIGVSVQKDEQLPRTLGVPVFQEQLMQMAMAVGDCTGEDADLLRRAMGSKRGIERIESLQAAILELEPRRKQKIREGLVKLLEEEVGKDKYDPNRMEQELIYYIEKIDLSEEQVRLKNHCSYFKQILGEEGDGKGKKLSFVLQEIGREINTTGAKGTHQTCTVGRKQ